MIDKQELRSLVMAAIKEGLEPGYRWALNIDPAAILRALDELEACKDNNEAIDQQIRIGEALEIERDNLAEQVSDLKQALLQCAVSLEEEMLQKYGSPVVEMHPVTSRSYERDMAEVRDFKAKATDSKDG